ncbi:MAG: GatB/YqeY domain-containing protein [Proteobacteria bacterium]|nr:GatB/YqeY domain-containing protein [Pseudomonadota bacterium]
MSALKQTLNQATKEAMRARDKERVATLRMVNAEVKRLEVDERRELSDDDIFAILNKMLKQRQDAQGQYVDAGRDDLAAIEAYEITVIQTFLPEQMDAEELSAFVAEIITEAGAGGMQDMGKVMGLLKTKGEGRVDMGRASALVKAQLSS